MIQEMNKKGGAYSSFKTWPPSNKNHLFFQIKCFWSYLAKMIIENFFNILFLILVQFLELN